MPGSRVLFESWGKLLRERTNGSSWRRERKEADEVPVTVRSMDVK
jgi:hypothetical protein